MAIPQNWNTFLSNAGSSTLGNPADLGPYRGLIQARGMGYDEEAADRMEWAKKQFAKNAGVADQVQQQALDTGRTFMDWARTDRGDYDTIYRPAMKEQMDYARSYTTPERMAANRGAAIAGSNITFDAASDMAKRALMSYGVDPSAGRFAGLDAGLAAKRAASAAGVGTKSDRDTEMMGQQLLANAIRTGQVLPGQAANQAGVSLAAGNQAVNTGLATTASGAQTMGTGLQWAGLGDDMVKEWANSLLRQTTLGMQQNRDVAEQQLAQAKLAQGGSSGTGAMLGMGAGVLGALGKSGAFKGMFGGTGGGVQTGGESWDMGTGMGGGGENAGAIIGAAGSSGYPSIAIARGGKVRKPVKRFYAGGPLGEEMGDDQDWDEWTNKAGMFNSLDPTGYAGFATDAVDIVGDVGGGADHDFERGDSLGIFPDSELDQGEQIGGSGGSLVGRIIGSFFGAPGIGAMAGRDAGEGIGAMVQGRFGEGFENMGRNALTTGENLLAQGGGGMGMGGLPGMDMFAAAEGGEIPEEGDQMVTPDMSPSGGEETDDVHAMLNEGEFVIPKDVTNWHGEKFFQRLIEKARMEMTNKVAEPEEGPPVEVTAMAEPSFASPGTQTAKRGGRINYFQSGGPTRAYPNAAGGWDYQGQPVEPGQAIEVDQIPMKWIRDDTVVSAGDAPPVDTLTAQLGRRGGSQSDRGAMNRLFARPFSEQFGVPGGPGLHPNPLIERYGGGDNGALERIMNSPMPSGPAYQPYQQTPEEKAMMDRIMNAPLPQRRYQGGGGVEGYPKSERVYAGRYGGSDQPMFPLQEHERWLAERGQKGAYTYEPRRYRDDPLATAINKQPLTYPSPQLPPGEVTSYDVTNEPLRRRRMAYEEDYVRNPRNREQAWLDYKNDVRRIDPKFQFPDEEPGVPGVYGYQEGGRAEGGLRERLNDFREGERRGDLNVPIGRGNLAINTEITPMRQLQLEGGYEHPIGNRGTSLGVEGYYRKQLGPYSEEVKPDYGLGFILKQKFQQGGPVQMAAKGDIVTGRDFGEDNDDQWESIGERWLDDKGGYHEDFSPDEINSTYSSDPKTGKLIPGGYQGQLRHKDTEKGRRREYYKPRQGVPTS